MNYNITDTCIKPKIRRYHARNQTIGNGVDKMKESMIATIRQDLYNLSWKGIRPKEEFDADI
ncbi:5748_t:CDS:2, partial [Acaulospora morrowiae]